MRRFTASLVRYALLLGLILAPVACDEPGREKVTIMVPWSGTEFEAFYAVVKDFEREHPDIEVEPQVTRALTQQLDAASTTDTKPDLAVLPTVGAIAKYREERVLLKLDIDTDAYVQPFRGLGMNDGEVYAVPVKADVKSLIWYDAEIPARPPGNWAAAMRSRTGWCLGLESGPTSGWPGADWIADILLSGADNKMYTKWVSGRVEWNKKPVKDAWTMWGQAMAGALEDASTRNFHEAAKGMAGDGIAKDKAVKECAFAHGALSAMPFESARVRDDQYTYSAPSPGGPLEVSADFVGKFTRNKAADEFLRYLAGSKAQQTWVNKPGFALSANKRVTQYDNIVQGRIAKILRFSRHTLCFSAADAMAPDVSAAFYRAVLAYANGKKLTPLLEALDRVQENLGYARPKSPPPPEPLCSTPNSP